MKAIQLIKSVGGAACLSLALAAHAQVTTTTPADTRPIAPAPHETASEHISDATLTTKVKAALATTSDLKALHIHVKTREGVVRLTGSVPDEAQRKLAAETAMNVSGVKSIRNNLKIVAK